MRLRARFWFVAGVSLVLTLTALSADDSDVIFPGGNETAAPRAPAATVSSGLNSVSLVAGIILAGVGGWYFWRNRRTVPASRVARSLAIDETRSLGNRQYLVVASHQGKKFLLGVCPGQISFLSALPDATETEGSRR
jgi:flagellar protein FliO/FliZ